MERGSEARSEEPREIKGSCLFVKAREAKSWIVHSIVGDAAREEYGALFRAFRANDSGPLKRFLYDRVAGR